MLAHTTAPTEALSAPPALRLIDAADALIGALADVLRAAKAEGVEVPREAVGDIGPGQQPPGLHGGEIIAGSCQAGRAVMVEPVGMG
jgi:hypothetical protein